MKPKRNGPRSTITTIYVRPADYKRLVRLAAEQDRSVASVVTLALDALLGVPTKTTKEP